MNNWYRIGLPVLIALLLIVATVGITLAVTGRSTAAQTAIAGNSAVSSGAELGRGSLCSNCPASGQVSAATTSDDEGPVYVPGGYSGSCCAGTASGTTGQTTGYRGGCCRTR